ncbi:MAG: hypothetical protein E7391_03935 [Ruminococcaceae bacterium]|nr:hypothetical protein [Oscillospiraceae bacterium]
MKKLVKRSDKVAYYGLKQADGSVIYKKMLGFSELNVSKNPKEYTRQYTTDDFETTSVIGYSPSMSFAFDRYKGNEVQDDIVNIFDKEITGSSALRTILIVDKNDETYGGYNCKKRLFAVVPDNEGNSTDAYTYSGNFKCKGKSVSGVAKLDISGNAIFLKEISRETFDNMTTSEFANFVTSRFVMGGGYRKSGLSLCEKDGNKYIEMGEIRSRSERIKIHDIFGKREFTKEDIGRTFKICVLIAGGDNLTRIGIFSPNGTSPIVAVDKITKNDFNGYTRFELDYTVTADTLNYTLLGIDQNTEDKGYECQWLYIDDIFVYEYENVAMPIMTLDEVLEETTEVEEKESTETEETEDATEIQS